MFRKVWRKKFDAECEAARVSGAGLEISTQRQYPFAHADETKPRLNAALLEGGLAASIIGYNELDASMSICLGVGWKRLFL